MAYIFKNAVASGSKTRTGLNDNMGEMMACPEAQHAYCLFFRCAAWAATKLGSSAYASSNAREHMHLGMAHYTSGYGHAFRA